MPRLPSDSLPLAFVGLILITGSQHPSWAAEVVVHDQAGQVAEYETWLMDNYEQAQDFVLTTPTRLTHVTAWLAEGRNPGNNNGVLDGLAGISWGLYGNNGAQPGGLITFGYDPRPSTSDTPLVFAFGGDIFQVTTQLATSVLGPGRYWISLHNGAWQSPNDSRLGWSTTLTKRFDFASKADDLRVPGNDWTGGSEQAFILYGEAVPEPSTFALVAIGAWVATLGRRYRP